MVCWLGTPDFAGTTSPLPQESQRCDYTQQLLRSNTIFKINRPAEEGLGGRKDKGVDPIICAFSWTKIARRQIRALVSGP